MSLARQSNLLFTKNSSSLTTILNSAVDWSVPDCIIGVAVTAAVLFAGTVALSLVVFIKGNLNKSQSLQSIRSPWQSTIAELFTFDGPAPPGRPLQRGMFRQLGMSAITSNAPPQTTVIALNALLMFNSTKCLITISQQK